MRFTVNQYFFDDASAYKHSYKFDKYGRVKYIKDNCIGIGNDKYSSKKQYIYLKDPKCIIPKAIIDDCYHNRKKFAHGITSIGIQKNSTRPYFIDTIRYNLSGDPMSDDTYIVYVPFKERTYSISKIYGNAIIEDFIRIEYVSDIDSIDEHENYIYCSEDDGNTIKWVCDDFHNSIIVKGTNIKINYERYEFSVDTGDYIDKIYFDYFDKRIYAYSNGYLSTIISFFGNYHVVDRLHYGILGDNKQLQRINTTVSKQLIGRGNSKTDLINDGEQTKIFKYDHTGVLQCIEEMDLTTQNISFIHHTLLQSRENKLIATDYIINSQLRTSYRLNENSEMILSHLIHIDIV